MRTSRVETCTDSCLYAAGLGTEPEILHMLYILWASILPLSYIYTYLFFYFFFFFVDFILRRGLNKLPRLALNSSLVQVELDLAILLPQPPA